MNVIRGLLCLMFCSSCALAAAETESVSAASTAKAGYVPGLALSQGITEITGVAISPLLGVSSVGAWRYWKTPAAVVAFLV